MENSYARMIFVAVVLALTVLFCVIAVSKAEAHRIPVAGAEATWYSIFSWHCGNGDTWFCGTRNLELRCWATSGAPHRNTCRYQFSEHRFAGNDRYCTISGDLLHYDVYSWREYC